jgi:hypothetical protein
MVIHMTGVSPLRRSIDKFSSYRIVIFIIKFLCEYIRIVNCSLIALGFIAQGAFSWGLRPSRAVKPAINIGPGLGSPGPSEFKH